MSLASFSSQQQVSLTELRTTYNILSDYLATFPGEASDSDSPIRERDLQRFSKFQFHHIRDYTLDVADEVERRLWLFESLSRDDIVDDDFNLVLSKAKPARLRLANLSDDVFRSVVADIHAELTRRYFGSESPFELHLRRQYYAKTAEHYFSAAEKTCVRFTEIFADESCYRQLLTYRGEKAQALLNLLSMLVDHPSLKPSEKSCMIKTVMRLSQRSFLYPQSLLIEGIKRDDIPYTGGSFGDIYRGTFRGQAVGLKVVKIYTRTDMSRVFKAFSREAMLWAHLCHPNILPFYGIFRLGDLHGRLALVSPWMAKGNMRNYLKDEPDADRILLLEDIVNGLQYLQDNRVVHGDLKGDNILITSSGRACLADFGLSNVVLTRLGNWSLKSTFLQVGGAVGWMAPELLLQDNAKPTTQGDIYALAMVFYEVFEGKMPFYEAATPAAIILRAIAGRRPTPPVNDSLAYTLLGLSQEIWDVMDKGWSSDPGARPPLQEFLRVLSGSERVDRRPKDTFGEALPPSKFRDAMNGVYRRMTIGEIEQIVSWFA